MEKALKFLRWKVKDKLTGFTGIVTHIGLDVSGCLQAIVKPEVLIDKISGKQDISQGEWLDVARLQKLGDSPAFEPIPQKGTELTAGSDHGKPIK